jgi:hypothetical protein
MLPSTGFSLTEETALCYAEWAIFRLKESAGMSARRLVFAAGIVLVLAAAYLVWVRKDMSDLRVPIRAGQRLLAGETLYRASDGHLQFKYSPPSAILFIPLSLVPYESAKLVWYVLEIACLTGVCVLSRKILSVEKKKLLPFLALTFLVLLKFLGREIELGQINIPILFLLILMLWLLIVKREIAAGLAWGLSLFFKPYALIFLPYLVIKKRTKAAVSGLGLFAAGLAVPAIFLGFRGNLAVLTEWPATLSRSTRGLLAVYDNASLTGFLLKAFPALSIRAAAAAVGLAALAAALGVLWLIGRGAAVVGDGWHPEALEGAVLLILMPLLSPLGWNYNYLYSWLAVMLIISVFSALPPAWRVVQAANFTIIGTSLVEVWGKPAFHFYTQRSLVVINYLIVLVVLFYLRAREIA